MHVTFEGEVGNQRDAVVHIALELQPRNTHVGFIAGGVEAGHGPAGIFAGPAGIQRQSVFVKDKEPQAPRLAHK